MNYKTKINKAIKLFEVKERDNGEKFVICNDDLNSRLRESIRQAHGDKLPDDWTYSTYLNCLEKLAEYEINNSDDLDDIRAEAVDSMVDVYTHDLTAWLAEDINNVYWLSEAIEQYQPEDGFKALSVAQYLAIDEVMGFVIDYLKG